MDGPPSTPVRTAGPLPLPPSGPGRAIGAALSRFPALRLVLLLSAPLTWLVAVYVVALAALLVTALWQVDSFTGNLDRGTLSTDNLRTVLTGSLYRTVTLRTVGVAALVTVIDVVAALPISFFIAKVARPSTRRILVVAVLTPLWASYLVKVFAWRAVLSEGGLLEWLGAPLGLESPGYGMPAVVLTQAYLWLPYVILPIVAGLERVPDSLLEASGDLGAGTWLTVRAVVWPLLRPAIIAGSIFSFSLTLGDYITVNIVGGAGQMLGNLVYVNAGAANNLPLAAAIALIPVLVMIGYLSAVRRTGALEGL